MSDDTPEVDFAPRPIRPLLTESDFLRVVPISRSTLARLIETGQLRAIRIGNKKFFAPDDVEAFLRSLSSAPGTLEGE